MKRLEVRDFRVGDEAALQAVFHSAVHMTAIQSYTRLQIDAWAPHEIDMGAWVRRMRELRPFVVESGGRIVGYADVQANGYMDHFFVAGACARHGVGTARWCAAWWCRMRACENPCLEENRCHEERLKR